MTRLTSLSLSLALSLSLSLSLFLMCVALHFGNIGEKIAVSPSYHNLFISRFAKEE